MNILHEIKLAFVENKNILIIATLIFVIPFLIGFFFKPYFYHIFNPIVENTTRKLKDDIIQFTFQDIFLNNLGLLCKLFIFGIFIGISSLLLIQWFLLWILYGRR